MKLTTTTLGPLATNCYILEGRDSHCIVVDPAADGSSLIKLTEERHLTVDAIFVTHCHFDHIGGLRALAEATGAPVYLHPDDRAIEEEMSYHRLTVTVNYPKELDAAGLHFTVYHTPGHSPGSVCIAVEDILFTGDTLFEGCCGRTDLPGGNWGDMAQSLLFLSGLSGKYKLYPGHGDSTTLAEQLETNPYLREAAQ